ncbi:MAG: MATE family efflux transporter [Clostridia bacterium]
MGKPNSLGTDKLFSLILKLAIPSMVAQLVNVLYGIVDRVFISYIPGIGDLALAGVGVCVPIATLITSFSFLLGLGGAPLAAMKLGEGKPEIAEKIMSNAMTMLIIMSAIITVVFFIFKKPMLLAFGASEATLPYANEYLSVYILGSIFSLLTMGLNNFIVCQGFSKQGMMTVILGAVINLCLDPLFIFVFKMNVFGAALATVIAQMASCIWVLLFLTGKSTTIKLKFQKLVPQIMLKIVTIGLSPFFIMMTESVAIIVLNTVLQKYGGDLYITAGTIVVSFVQIITSPMGGMTMGCQPILSFNYGARNDKRVLHAFVGVALTCMAYGAFMLILAFSLPQFFVAIFTSDAQISAIAVEGIKYFGSCLIFLGLQYACVDNLVALGASAVSVTLSLIRKLGLVIPLTLLLPRFYGASAVFLAEPIAFTLSCAISLTTVLIVYKKLMSKHKIILDM